MRNFTRERWSREAAARRRELERLEAAALEQRPRGPNLPAWCFRNERVYVTRTDLDELAGRGPELFRRYRRELELRAAAAGLLPLELALLYVLVWCHLRRPGGDGAGLQVEVGDLAELLPGRDGTLSRSWAYELVRRLEARGLVRRRRRLRRYLNLTRELGPAGAYVDADGQLHPFRRWKDRDGVLREFVDVQGVLYATPRAVALVLGPTRARGRALVHNLWTELWRTLRVAGRNSTARLSSAAGAGDDRTPYAVSALLESIFLRARAQKSGVAPHGRDDFRGRDPPTSRSPQSSAVGPIRGEAGRRASLEGRRGR